MRRRAVVAWSVLWSIGCAAPGSDLPGGGALDPGGKSDGTGERDPVAAIADWNAGLSADDRHAKFCKMAASPFVFYRGTNHLFWADLGRDARLAELGSPLTETWIQGDLHPENLGTFDDDDGVIVYGVNDFDESVIADYQLDLWRMAASLVLVAEDNGERDRDRQASVIDAFVESYLDAMDDYSCGDGELDAKFDEHGVSGRLNDLIDDVAGDESREQMLESWTEVIEGERLFDLSLAKLEAAPPQQDAELREAMAGYLDTLSGGLDSDPGYFAVKDVARRLLAGTGSLGTPRYYVLIEGKSGDPDDDRILDVKRQGMPTAIVFAEPDRRARYSASFDNHAERHAAAYKAMMDDTDDHLGWMALSDGFYSVRERSFAKDALGLDELESIDDFRQVAADWGEILAATHARADDDFDPALVGHSVDSEITELVDGRHDHVRALVRDVAFTYAGVVVDDWLQFVDQLAPLDCLAE